MTDPNPNLKEILEALEAERLHVQVVQMKVENYKQAVKNLSNAIIAIMDNVTITGSQEAVATALTTWRDTLRLLVEDDEIDERSKLG